MIHPDVSKSHYQKQPLAAELTLFYYYFSKNEGWKTQFVKNKSMWAYVMTFNICYQIH